MPLSETGKRRGWNIGVGASCGLGLLEVVLLPKSL